MADAKVLVIVLAGGEGKRLLPLTNDRAKPAVPFGGSLPPHRLRAVQLRQRRATSRWSCSRSTRATASTATSARRGASRRCSATTSRRCRRRCGGGRSGSPGSADAIYQNLNLISRREPRPGVRVRGRPHLPDGSASAHRPPPRRAGAGVTVAAIPVPRHEAREFGVIESDADGRILAFHEKVADPPTMPGDDKRCLASMGNYVFDTATLIDVVTPRDDALHRPRRPRHPGAHRVTAWPTCTTSPRTSCPVRTTVSAATGATSGRSTPTTRRTWT